VALQVTGHFYYCKGLCDIWTHSFGRTGIIMNFFRFINSERITARSKI